MRVWLSPIDAVLVRVDARRGELLADPRAVRVDDLAEQQLGPDRQDFTSHLRGSSVVVVRSLALPVDPAVADDREPGHDRERDRDVRARRAGSRRSRP